MFVQQQMGSQPSMVHGAKTSQPNAMGMPQQMYQHAGMTGASSFPDISMSQAKMTSDPMMMPQQASGQPFMQQQQQPNPQQQFQQQFPYRSPPQMQQQSTMGDNIVNQQQPGMMRFPQTSPTQPNQPQRMPFGNMKNMNAMPQRQNVPMLSPRPTPPPVSPSVTPGMLSPTGSTSSHQGSFNQMDASPSQQTVPQAQNNSANMFQTSSGEVNMGDQSKSNFPFNQNVNPVQQQVMGQGANSKPGDVNVAVSNPGLSPQSQGSPVKKVMSPAAVASPQNISMEIQNVNQQLQQLLGMPQNPNTQQKKHELQEKLRVLKAQQMQMSPRPGQAQQQQPQQALPQQQQPLQSNLPTPVQQQMPKQQQLQSNIAQQQTAQAGAQQQQPAQQQQQGTSQPQYASQNVQVVS